MGSNSVPSDLMGFMESIHQLTAHSAQSFAMRLFRRLSPAGPVAADTFFWVAAGAIWTDSPSGRGGGPG
jgi:hypothetical protein